MAAEEFLGLFPVAISLLCLTHLPPLFLVISSAKDCHSYLIVLGMATSMCPQKNSECLLRVLMHDALLEEFFAVFQKSCGALPLVDVS